MFQLRLIYFNSVLMLHCFISHHVALISAFFVSLAFASETPPHPNPTLISPDNGPESGGTEITITGDHFGVSQDDLINVTIVGEEMLDIKWINETMISGKTPPKRDGGKGAVIVTTKKGGTSHDDVKFTYNYRTSTI